LERLQGDVWFAGKSRKKAKISDQSGVKSRKQLAQAS
jgi:hypothetical protein